MNKKTTIFGVAGLFGFLVATALLVACSSGGYSGPVSDHFDGRQFHNPVKAREKTVMDLLKWRFNRDQAEDAWQRVEEKASVAIPQSNADGILATFINPSQYLSQALVIENCLKVEGLTHVVELDWWQEHALDNQVVITGTPAQHWSTRTRIDHNRTLWLGYRIGDGRSQVFFAGDTGMGPHFARIQERFGSMDLSLLPIGAYLPRWFMKDNHLSPDDALAAHYDLQSRQSMAIHFGMFNLGDDGQDTASHRLRALLEDEQHQQVDFMIPEPGGQVHQKSG